MNGMLTKTDIYDNKKKNQVVEMAPKPILINSF
jgi:hypothetical protein